VILINSNSDDGVFIIGASKNFYRRICLAGLVPGAGILRFPPASINSTRAASGIRTALPILTVRSIPAEIMRFMVGRLTEKISRTSSIENNRIPVAVLPIAFIFYLTNKF
jgi:hypothetical protein